VFWPSKTKENEKIISSCWDTPNQWGKESNWRTKRPLTSKEEKSIKENIFKNQVLESIGSLEKLPILQQGKITTSVGHAEK